MQTKFITVLHPRYKEIKERLRKIARRLSVKNKVFKRDGWKCVKCGSEQKLQLDHIVPISAGGTNNIANLQTLCRSCHKDKTKQEHLMNFYKRSQIILYV